MKTGNGRQEDAVLGTVLEVIKINLPHPKS